jgi:hypothetical protein
MEVVIYNWPLAKAQAKLSGSANKLKTTYDAAHGALHVFVPDAATQTDLSVEGFHGSAAAK